MTDELSISAQLRQALAERDEARHGLAHVRFQNEIQHMRIGNLRDLRAEALAERELARAELVSARTELEQLRATREWAVADRYVHDCAICKWAIQRGEAFQPLPGAKGSFRHVLCSRPTQETS